MLKNTIIMTSAVVISGLLMSCSNNKLDSLVVTKPQLAAVTNTAPPPIKQFKLYRVSPTAEQTIIFNTPVAYETVEVAIAQLENLRKEGYKEAFLVLDSPGGSVLDGARLVSYMNGSTMKVHTICDGMCASMAAHLFETGDIRYMTDKSLLMFHPASGGIQGTLEQMLNQLTMFKRFVDRMDLAVAERSGIDYKEFKDRLVSEYWIETEDAITENLADRLVFLTYSRDQEGSLNVSNYLKSKSINVPEQLKRPGVLVYESIRLQH